MLFKNDKALLTAEREGTIKALSRINLEDTSGIWHLSDVMEDNFHLTPEVFGTFCRLFIDLRNEVSSLREELNGEFR